MRRTPTRWQRSGALRPVATRPVATRPVWPAALLIAAGLAIGATLDLETPVQAASPDAWEQYQRDVTEACAAASGLADPQVRLDPFGTASYGVARVIGKGNDGHAVTVVCVLRKTPDGPADVEISAPLQDWVTLR